MLLGGQGHPGAAHQGPHPLGAVELVAAEPQQVDAQLLHGQGDVAHGLGAIAVEQGAPLAAEGTDGGQGLEHADLVVGGHHRHQQGVWPHDVGQLIKIHQAIAPHRQHGDGESVPRQPGQGIEHGSVFGGEGH